MAALSTTGNGAELSLALAFLGEAEQLLLGELDLLAAGLRAPGVEGAVDRILADPDQATLEGEIVDQPAVLDGVDDRVRGLRQRTR